MSDREIQIAELSQQLTTAFEQSQACVRQQQLCKNQIQKSEITMAEVAKNPNKMYRACGRMFVLADAAQMKKDLQVDLDKLNAEKARVEEMNKNFEAKKEILTSQLNALTPKDQKWEMMM